MIETTFFTQTIESVLSLTTFIVAVWFCLSAAVVASRPKITELNTSEAIDAYYQDVVRLKISELRSQVHIQGDASVLPRHSEPHVISEPSNEAWCTCCNRPRSRCLNREPDLTHICPRCEWRDVDVTFCPQCDTEMIKIQEEENQ